MTRRIWHCIKSHLRPYSRHPFNNCCFHYSIFSIFAQIWINNHKFCRRYQCTQCLHQIHIILHKKHTTCILYLELTVYEVWIEKYVSWNAASVSKSQQHSWKKTAGPVLEVCSAESLLDGNSWISYHFKIIRRKILRIDWRVGWWKNLSPLWSRLRLHVDHGSAVCEFLLLISSLHMLCKEPFFFFFSCILWPEFLIFSYTLFSSLTGNQHFILFGSFVLLFYSLEEDPLS